MQYGFAEMHAFILIAGLVSAGCVSVPKQSSAASARSGMVDVGGTSMYYEISGSGQPVLFLHSGIADCGMWDEQVRVFSREYRVIRCDLRGFGKTPRGSVPFSQYRDLATLLDSLGIERAHVVGSSFGGRVAIDFALACPRRVLSLVLCSPAISGAPSTPELDVIDSTEESLLKNGDLAGAAGFEVRTWVVGPYRNPGEVSPALQQRVKSMLEHTYSLPSQPGARSVPLEPRAMTRLEDIHVPTLMMIGDKDVPSFQDLSLVASQRIPQAQRIVVPGAAHMINMEKPKEFNRILLDFIAHH